MELLQLYDENINRVDESVDRAIKNSIPNNRFFMVIIVFIQNEEGKFLVQYTSPKRGSIYAFTGGHVNYGDDYYETVFKEAYEELGLKLDKDKLHYVAMKPYQKAYCAIYHYKDNIDINNLVLQKEEVENVYWLSKDEIEDLIDKDLLRTSNIELFRIVNEYLDKA